jgi:uncharacterized protein YbdZ (MbtH family)
MQVVDCGGRPGPDRVCYAFLKARRYLGGYEAGAYRCTDPTAGFVAAWRTSADINPGWRTRHFRSTMYFSSAYFYDRWTALRANSRRSKTGLSS